MAKGKINLLGKRTIAGILIAGVVFTASTATSVLLARSIGTGFRYEVDSDSNVVACGTVNRNKVDGYRYIEIENSVTGTTEYYIVCTVGVPYGIKYINVVNNDEVWLEYNNWNSTDSADKLREKTIDEAISPYLYGLGLRDPYFDIEKIKWICETIHDTRNSKNVSYSDVSTSDVNKVKVMK